MPPQNESIARRPVAPGDGATLDQWLGYLESIHPTEIDLGLDRVLLVLRRLFRRNPAARIITIAGTNGKGSAVAALEQLLMAAGRSTGAYTSPHLQRYNERVRINGADVSDDQLVEAFSAVEAARRDTTLTYFEFGTLAAFVLFQEAGLDDWVLEVGLGGRLDAVNVLDPDLAIITSVDIDHVSFLGDNREVIGFEKAGILRPGISAIYADIDPPTSVLQQAAAQKVRLERPGESYQLVPSGASGEPDEGFWLEQARYGDRIFLPDTGLPVHSLAAAVVALRQLEPEMGVQAIEGVIATLKLAGRYEVLGSRPMVVADVGHNPTQRNGWLPGLADRARRPGGLLPSTLLSPTRMWRVWPVPWRRWSMNGTWPGLMSIGGCLVMIWPVALAAYFVNRWQARLLWSPRHLAGPWTAPGRKIPWWFSVPSTP